MRLRLFSLVALLLGACTTPTPTPAGTVTGTLLDARHQPLGGLIVSSKVAQSTWQSPLPASGTGGPSFTNQAINPDSYSRATTAPDGSFSLPVYEALVDVSVWRPSGAITVSQPVKTNVAVAAGATTALGTVTLPDLPGTGASASPTSQP